MASSVSRADDETGGGVGSGAHPPPLSSGAGRALGTVLKRLLDPSKDANNGIASASKRPRGDLGLILAADEDVAEAAAEEQAETAKDRENRRARLQFQGLGRVYPDAATNAPLEKNLRETATRGVLALFNAVAKAQKVADVGKSAPDGTKNKEAVTRESFMEMIRAGVAKTSKTVDEGDQGPHAGAKWMNDDYMTEGARKLKNWNKEEDADVDSEDDEEDSDVEGDSGSKEGAPRLDTEQGDSDSSGSSSLEDDAHSSSGEDITS
jgi:hypothetical protein